MCKLFYLFYFLNFRKWLKYWKSFYEIITEIRNYLLEPFTWNIFVDEQCSECCKYKIKKKGGERALSEALDRY
jgi:hypothetical protein